MAGTDPIPEIETLTPVPEGSLTFHDNRTVELLPAITEAGEAENVLIAGAGQALALTVVVAVDCPPHPARAVSV